MSCSQSGRLLAGPLAVPSWRPSHDLRQRPHGGRTPPLTRALVLPRETATPVTPGTWDQHPRVRARGHCTASLRPDHLQLQRPRGAALSAERLRLTREFTSLQSTGRASAPRARGFLPGGEPGACAASGHFMHRAPRDPPPSRLAQWRGVSGEKRPLGFTRSSHRRPPINTPLVSPEPAHPLTFRPDSSDGVPLTQASRSLRGGKPDAGGGGGPQGPSGTPHLDSPHGARHTSPEPGRLALGKE